MIMDFAQDNRIPSRAGASERRAIQGVFRNSPCRLAVSPPTLSPNPLPNESINRSPIPGRTISTIAHPAAGVRRNSARNSSRRHSPQGRRNLVSAPFRPCKCRPHRVPDCRRMFGGNPPAIERTFGNPTLAESLRRNPAHAETPSPKSRIAVAGRGIGGIAHEGERAFPPQPRRDGGIPPTPRRSRRDRRTAWSNFRRNSARSESAGSDRKP